MNAWEPYIELSRRLDTVFRFDPSRPVATTNTKVISDIRHTTTTYTSETLAKGTCISILDARESKSLWMMHVAAFSATAAPVYGFDVITSSKKVTGCFHDLSPTVESPLVFEHDFTSERTRALPPWAQKIFSPNMIAAANPSPEQAIQLQSIAENTLSRFLSFAETNKSPSSTDYLNALAKYCENQLSNTNSKNVMVALGLPEDYVNEFKKRQFPWE